jgi:hypothetical protein
MYKNATNKEKIAILKIWMPSIIEVIKKDLKNDHLKKDPIFVKHYFASKNLQKITTEELVEAYITALSNEAGADKIFDMISYFWLSKKSEVYDYFETVLSKINPNFTEIDQIDNERSQSIITSSVGLFGAPTTYVFSVLNSVVFSDEAYKNLKEKAEKEFKDKIHSEEELTKELAVMNDVESLKREVARLTDKYEKKLSGLQKKYLIDTEALKKQVSSLQRKMAQ